MSDFLTPADDPTLFEQDAVFKEFMDREAARVQEGEDDGDTTNQPGEPSVVGDGDSGSGDSNPDTSNVDATQGTSVTPAPDDQNDSGSVSVQTTNDGTGESGTDDPTALGGIGAIEGEGGVEGEAGPSQSLTPPTPEPFTPITFGEEVIDQGRLQRMVELDSAVASWTPEAHTAVNAVLSGEAVVIDRATAQRYAQMEAANQGQANQGQQGTPPVADPATSTTPSPTVLSDEALADLDPALAAVIRSQQHQLAAIQAQQVQAQSFMQQQAEAQQAQQRAALLESIKSAEATWGTEHQLSAEKTETYMRQIGQLQMLPGLMHAHNGDVNAAVRQALQMVSANDPEFQRAVITQSPIDPAIEARKGKAASLSGSGGTGKREVKVGSGGDTPAPKSGSANGSSTTSEIAAYLREVNRGEAGPM